MPNKYLITLWEKQFDWDGLYEEFKILGQYESLVEAVIDFPPLIEQVLSEAIERGAQDKVVWQEFEIDYEQLNQDHRDYFQGLGLAEGIPNEVYNNLDFVKRYFHLPNRYNYVIASSLRALADVNLPHYNKNYYSVQLVELPAGEEITPDLFNPEECRGEVEWWFKKKNKIK